MRRRKTYKRISIFLICLIILCIFPIKGAAEENDQKIIRVGYVLAAGYQSGSAGQPKDGFGYEYLQKIASYTGWKYEYVYGSFTDLLEGVENGTIDIMGNVSKTDTRIGKYDFGTYPQGSEVYYLITKAEGSSIDRHNLSTINGKRIGINKGSVQIELFQQWLKEQGYNSVDIIEMESLSERTEALNNGTIDGMVSSQIDEDQNWISACSIGSSDFYFVTNNKKPWLKQELDEAQKKILDTNPNYNGNLYRKYHYDSHVANKTLTRDELEWIEQKGIVKVGYLNKTNPYCFTDEHGAMTGMYRNFFDHATERYGLRFEYSPYDDYGDLIDALQDSTIDLVIPMYFDYWTAEQLKVSLVDELVTSSMSIITNRDVKEPRFDRIAVSDKNAFSAYFTEKQYFASTLIWKDSPEECVEAVRTGEADCTIFNSDILSILRYSVPELNDMMIRDLHNTIGVSMAVSTENQQLVSIMNKMIAMTSAAETMNRMVEYSAASDTFQWKQVINRYASRIILGLILGFSTILAFVIRGYRRSVKHKKQLQEALDNFKQADYDRRIDFLTGLHNRQDMFEMLQYAKADESQHLYAMFMMDIDNYKSYNDHYGHVKGDECLQTISKALIAYGEKNHMRFYRYGGEEILGIVFTEDKENSQIAEELVRLVFDLDLKRTDVPTGRVTVSVGYTVNNNDYDKMVDYADSAMYYAKTHGKNQAICYELTT